MWSLESRRDPVHQAALAFFLLAGMAVASFALESPHPAMLAFAALVSLIGVFVWQRSLGALVIGTAFFVLFCVAGFVGSRAHHMSSAAQAIAFGFYGVLLFVMVRGLVSLVRKPATLPVGGG